MQFLEIRRRKRIGVRCSEEIERESLLQRGTCEKRNAKDASIVVWTHPKKVFHFRAIFNIDAVEADDGGFVLLIGMSVDVKVRPTTNENH